jgi:hypothetical protein
MKSGCKHPTQHKELSLGKINNPCDTVDNHKTEANHGIDAAHADTTDGEL